jgi:hypothetical protein
VDATDTSRLPNKLAPAEPVPGGTATPWWEAPVAPSVPSAREWAIAGAPAEDGATSASRPGSGEQFAAPAPMAQYQQQHQSLEGLLSAPLPPHPAEARAAHAYEARLVKHLSHGQWTLLSMLGDRVKGCPMPPAVGLSLKAFIVARPHLFHLLWDGNQGTWRAKLRTKPLQTGSVSPAVSVAAMPAASTSTSVMPHQTAARLDCEPVERGEPKAAVVAANPWRMSHPLPDCAQVETGAAPAMEQPCSISGGMAPPAPTGSYGLFSDHPLVALGAVLNGHGGGGGQLLTHMQHPSGTSAYDVLCGPHRHSTASLGGFSQAVAAASGAAESMGMFGSGSRSPSTCFGDAAIRALALSAPSSPHHGQGRFTPTAGSAPLPCAFSGYPPNFGCGDMGAAMAGYMHLDASGGNAMGTQHQREGDDDTDALLLECLSMGAHSTR